MPGKEGWVVERSCTRPQPVDPGRLEGPLDLGRAPTAGWSSDHGEASGLQRTESPVGDGSLKVRKLVWAWECSETGRPSREKPLLLPTGVDGLQGGPNPESREQAGMGGTGPQWEDPLWAGWGGVPIIQIKENEEQSIEPAAATCKRARLWFPDQY